MAGKSSPRLVTLRVSFLLPEGASKLDAVRYVKTAVQAECGSNPDQPLADLDRKTIKVAILAGAHNAR